MSSLSRSLLLSLLVLGGSLGTGVARTEWTRPAANVPAPAAAKTTEVASSGLSIETGMGRVVTLHAAATNVFVADPKVLEVRPASATSLFMFGVGPGRTTVAAMDADGHVVSQYQVTVTPSVFNATEAQAAIARLMPGRHITARAQAKGLLLAGRVDSAEEAAQAMAIARDYVGDSQVVDNQLSIQSATQITLRVRIAEMSRTVVRNLGVNWQSVGTIGSIAAFPALSFTANGASIPVCSAGSGGSPGFTKACLGASFNGVIEALAQDNLAHLLAEPNLTVMSGQPASFLVGGEFPIPVGQAQGQITIEFKKYGVNLSFVPTVMSDGRINIHVAPEVSELSNDGAVQLTAGNASIQVPALVVRRAETTVELGSGETFAIAGLLMDSSTQSFSNLPYLENLPVLGPMFRSNAFQRAETELVIMITPIVVRPVDDAAKIHLPTDGFKQPTDFEQVFLGRQIGRSPGTTPVPISIPGDAGFIVQ
jgi:pilus assembly protein CpaC